jgi:hypothetical protein
MKTVTEIARKRDGGSLLVEYEGIRYFYDHGIGSKTHGKLFYPDILNPRSAEVPSVRSIEVIEAIKSQIKGYNV